MFPDKDTVVCISLASKPGNFGMAVHNGAFRAVGLNFLYKAFGVTDLKGAITGVRALGLRGCSVSMPFKEAVIHLIDEIDATALAIGAVNTVVNREGRLVGYNTDAYGAETIIGGLELPRTSRVLVLGGGGVARAIVFALKRLGFSQVRVANRTLQRVVPWGKAHGCEVIPWETRESVAADLIVNATSIGMDPEVDHGVVSEEAVKRSKAVMDVVVSQNDTALIAVARMQGRITVPGVEMSLHQAARQFELYTGSKAPIDVMRNSLRAMLCGTAGSILNSASSFNTKVR